MLKISSQSMYSSYERGEPHLPKEDARRIETELKLPNGWFERNNTEALFVAGDELALVMALKECTPDATTSLLNAVRSIRAHREG